MKLSKVKISNFRSFGHEENIDLSDFTTLIGSNSSGKTTFFLALLKLFGESGKEREITRADFHVPSNINPDSVRESNLSIEVVFDFPEVLISNGIEKYTVPTFFQNFVIVPKGHSPYIRIRLDATWHRSSQPEGIVDTSVYFITAPEGKIISNNHKKSVSNAQLSLIKVIYVPALRNPSAQLRMVSGTLLWRLINRINFKDSFMAEISEKIYGVEQILDNHSGISEIKKIMRDEWKHYHSDNRYNHVDLQFNTNDIESILKKIDPHFSPTEIENSYTVDSLGDGLRSLFYFSLVSSLLKTEEVTLKEIMEHPEAGTDDRTFSNVPPCLTIVAVEEPENHVSPHILGRVIENLKRLATNNNSQVLLSSHSPAIVKRVDPTDIRHFRSCKVKLATVTNHILLPKDDQEAYKYMKEAIRAYPEIYFSGLVVLGEGDSEEIILPRILDAIDVKINIHEVAVVPLGGRHVNHFWKLLHQLEIPFVTLLDLDLERNGGGFGRIKYVLKQLIANGHDKNKLLLLSDDTILSDERLEKMHNWENDIKIMSGWLTRLEQYGVFFSAPLDIDFLMLEKFLDFYIRTLEKNEGPRISEEELQKKIIDLDESDKLTDAYKKRLLHDVGCTLKDGKKTGTLYTDEQKELMIWYNYFFLNRGKPSTHISAMIDLDESTLSKKLPNAFKRFGDYVKSKLNIKDDKVE